MRTGSGYWKKNGDYNVNDPDYGSYLPVAEYQVMGLSEGTVTATGTPIDNKNHCRAGYDYHYGNKRCWNRRCRCKQQKQNESVRQCTVMYIAETIIVKNGYAYGR